MILGAPFIIDDPDSLFTNLVLVSEVLEDFDTVKAGLKPDFFCDIAQAGGVFNQLGELASTLSASKGKPLRVHLIGKGAPGQLNLSGDVLSQVTVEYMAIQFAEQPPEELLLYGSHISQGETGAKFCQSLSTFTGARVVASRKVVGLDDDGKRYWFDGLGYEPSLCFTDEFLASYGRSF